ncbi:Zinc finger protein CONSTANS-LIKE 5, partial [Cucurbita argyrosperma subsp. sororia]
MASIPQFFYTDYTTTTTSIIPNDFCDQRPPPTAPALGGGVLWGEETLAPLFDDFGLHHQPPISPSQYSSHKPGLTPTSFPHQDIIALPQLNTPSICATNNAAPCQSFCVGYQPDDHPLFQYPDDCFRLVPETEPLYHPLPPDNWEIQSNQVPVSEDSNMKVGRYSEEVRKERILRYLKKRNQRNFNKTIKYACRKTLADRRIRVRGRFARNNEACDRQLNPTKINHTSIHKVDTQLLYNRDHVGAQRKKDEEEWVEEMRGLMYLPYISS